MECELEIGCIDCGWVVSHEESNFGEGFGLYFFLHDCVVFSLGPCSEWFGKDVIGRFVVADFKTNPRAASFL